MSEKIKMTKQGLEKQKERLENLKKIFEENEKAMTKACQNSSGDGPHDNAEFEELLRQEKKLVNDINRLAESIRDIELIEITEMDDNYINIEDIVDINIIFSSDDEERMTIQLVGEEANGLDERVSINSPLGQAIYGKKIGETVSYKVNNHQIRVDLLEKVKISGKKY